MFQFVIFKNGDITQESVPPKVKTKNPQKKRKTAKSEGAGEASNNGG